MARLTDQFCVVAYIRSLTSGVEGEADNLGGAEFLRKLIPTNHPHSSSGRRLTGHCRHRSQCAEHPSLAKNRRSYRWQGGI